MKEYYFDRPKVMAKIDAARLRMLSRAGAFVRTSARSSLKRRKKVSEVGSPPSVHSTDDYATLKNILFAYDPASDSVVVGPVLVERGNRDPALAGASSTVPGILERGGTIGIREAQTSKGKWLPLRGKVKRFLSNKPQRIRQATIGARPFMLPALRVNAPKFPLFFTFTD